MCADCFACIGLAKGMTRVQMCDKLKAEGLGFDDINDIIHNLVKANCLHYSVDGKFTWQCLKKYLQDARKFPAAV